jgi:hypothetical protein
MKIGKNILSAPKTTLKRVKKTIKLPKDPKIVEIFVSTGRRTGEIVEGFFVEDFADWAKAAKKTLQRGGISAQKINKVWEQYPKELMGKLDNWWDTVSVIPYNMGETFINSVEKLSRGKF